MFWGKIKLELLAIGSTIIQESEGKIMTALALEQHIVATPSIRGGKPRLEGTRITVADVVIWHFHMGYSPDEIAVKWDLSLSAIYAALSYYYDHQNEIDEQIQAADDYHSRMKAATPSLLQEKLKGCSIGEIIETLRLIYEVLSPDEMRGRVEYL